MNFILFLFPKPNDCQMDRVLLFIPNFCFIGSYLGVTILLMSTIWCFLSFSWYREYDVFLSTFLLTIWVYLTSIC